MKCITLAIAIFCVLAGCGSNGGSKSASTASPGASPAGMTAYSPLANGRQIFLRGRDLDGVRITASPAALRPSCAACHGATGAGGMHITGSAVSADLRHKALVTDQKPPYTVALLERAISTGIDNTGQPLNPVMPRWKMSKRDLHDVAQYVLTLK